MAVLYMLHVESRPEAPKPQLANKVVGIDPLRREALKRFAKWVPCQCDRACGREWNFANEIGLQRGGNGSKCSVARLFERSEWRNWYVSKEMNWLQEMRRKWEDAVISK